MTARVPGDRTGFAMSAGLQDLLDGYNLGECKEALGMKVV